LGHSRFRNAIFTSRLLSATVFEKEKLMKLSWCQILMGGKVDSTSVSTSAWCFYQPPEVSFSNSITFIIDVINCHLLLALRMKDSI
jgi:hypothetical protein